MRRTRINIVTSISTQDLGNIFKTTTKSMHGIGGKLGRAGRSVTSYATDGFGFYRPDGDEFSSLDDDPAAFEVGVHIPTFSATNGGGVTLHMYVWDRGAQREVQLVAPHGMVSGAAKSKKRLRQLAEAIRAHDPAAAIAA